MITTTELAKTFSFGKKGKFGINWNFEWMMRVDRKSLWSDYNNWDLSNAGWRSHIQNKQKEVVLHAESIRSPWQGCSLDKGCSGDKDLHSVKERLDKHPEERAIEVY